MKRGAPGPAGWLPPLAPALHSAPLCTCAALYHCAAPHLSSSFAQWLRACRGAESWRKTLWSQFCLQLLGCWWIRISARGGGDGDEKGEVRRRRERRKRGREIGRVWSEQRNRCNGRGLLCCSESGGRGKCEGGGGGQLTVRVMRISM